MFRSYISLMIVMATLLSSCNLPFGVTATPAVPEDVSDPQVAAMRQLEAASKTPPDLYIQNGFPRFVSGSFLVEGADAVERARNFLITYNDLYRIANPDLDLAVRRVSEEGAEANVVFYQTYKGLEVFASEIVVTLNEDLVYATVGGLLNSDASLDVASEIPAPKAEQIASADLGLPDALVAGTTTLMVIDQSLLDDVPPEAHLVWRVTISDPASWQVFVDAHTGEVLFKYALTQDGAGLEDFDFEEFDALGGGSGACYYFTGDHIGDEDGLERRWHSNLEAVNLWWFARNTYLFYHDTFGRHSYDNDDSQLEVFIRADGGGNGAAWSSSCDLVIFEPGWVGQDILTHEFTHGVIRSTSDLVPANQSGAMNESYADVMASLMDGNWTMGENRVLGGGAIRNLSNPPALLDPDRMSNLSMTTRDNGGIHTNNGIPNKAAYLIAVGGTFNGWTITGIGNGKMGALFYATMINLGSSAQMIDARNATVARADRWALSGTKGFTPFDACQVQNAYTAVELGDGDTDCDGTDDATDPDNDGDYIPDSLDNCPQVANPGQQDTDSDRQGDTCDRDQDDDTVRNQTDNCPLVVNPGQQDSDGDDIGDACDDEDGDGVIDTRDNCPGVANSDQHNLDFDSNGDPCDTNDDEDSILDAIDNCPFVDNNDQNDTDGDGFGDYCDNSPLPNPDQADSDGDGIGDISDNCPRLANYHQEDADRDGVGDHCDGSDEFSLIPDGSLVDISIRGGPGQVRTMPIPVCLADTCPDWIPPNYLVSIVLTCPAADVGVWVTDDTGKSADRSPNMDDLRVLRFHPIGGRNYFLHLVFSPDFVEGGQVDCSASMSAGPADKQPNPTPQGPTPIPLIPPPPIELVTPSSGVPVAVTDTPTPAAPVILTFAKNAYCRKGPSALYKDVSGFKKGDTAQADGRNEVDPRWWWVQIPNSTEHCWVSHITVDPNLLAEDLPVEPTLSLELPAAPANFVISNRMCSPNGYVLKLGWTKSAGADGYTLYLNGQEIATFKSSQSVYQENPPLDKSLHYELEAFNENGFSERLVVEDRCP